MSRIVAGVAKGRLLSVPAKGTRPTSERVREALFSRLEHWDVLENACVLDLYAGSGALGLEALSRGASSATFVDQARSAVASMKTNIAATALYGRIVAKDVGFFLRTRQSMPLLSGEYTLVFVDPPYDLPEGELEKVLNDLGPWIMPDTLVVIERSLRSPEPVWPTFLQCEDISTWGETRCWFAGPPLQEMKHDEDIDMREHV
ncbi:RsmD family RNA methyltransferase [Schaalia sp. lx-260]|uniref:RsmD family RNA methyltransferase n=1 Tax=Schaalia sp. lx-260 TaxID=2899082 RepID=UPI001E35E4FC|nr:RsmD family RNA methyltransferase [Schaalia sp. lx-260]MCD4549871.1 RsmD family RNA methyltransferase [Schaalia sp. lx-260]